jgi:phosphohistidine phosphatase
MASKHLVLLRHAKSSWDDPLLDDHDRPLTPRGRRAAAQVGRYLRREGISPDLVLCSSATRTQETLDLLDLSGEPEVLIESALYGATATRLLDRLRRVEDRADSVLLIGHNPGIQEAVISLARDHEELADTFPTGALAELRLPIAAWTELRPGIARLKAYITPKSLR